MTWDHVYQPLIFHPGSLGWLTFSLQAAPSLLTISVPKLISMMSPLSPPRLGALLPNGVTHSEHSKCMENLAHGEGFGSGGAPGCIPPLSWTCHPAPLFYKAGKPATQGVHPLWPDSCVAAMKELSLPCTEARLTSFSDYNCPLPLGNFGGSGSTLPLSPATNTKICGYPSSLHKNHRTGMSGHTLPVLSVISTVLVLSTK